MQTKPHHERVKQALTKAESGQAIVLMALMMVALIAILGLAIDGGGLYFLWRDEQNAVDASALAASYARCTNGDPVLAALQAANSNGFDNNGTSNIVRVYSPPISGPVTDDPYYTEVVITAEKPAYFIQVVYPDDLEVTNSAIGFCIPPFDPATVPGLWAGSLVCQNTFNWTGSDSYIEGGIFSNNEIKITGSGSVVVGPVEAVTAVEESNAGNVDWDDDYPPASGVAPRSDPMNLDISLYAPGGAVQRVAPLYTAILSEADDEDYRMRGDVGVWKPGNGRTIEGLYFVDGDVDIGNGVNFGLHGISIVATGEIQFTGGTDVRYYDGVMNPTADGVRYPGILLFSTEGGDSDRCGDNAISFSGNSITTTGVLYAPDAGVNVSGSRLSMVGVVVADTIDYSASNGRFIYDPSLVPPRPPQIHIAR